MCRSIVLRVCASSFLNWMLCVGGNHATIFCDSNRIIRIFEYFQISTMLNGHWRMYGQLRVHPSAKISLNRCKTVHKQSMQLCFDWPNITLMLKNRNKCSQPCTYARWSPPTNEGKQICNAEWSATFTSKQMKKKPHTKANFWGRRVEKKHTHKISFQRHCGEFHHHMQYALVEMGSNTHN